MSPALALPDADPVAATGSEALCRLQLQVQGAVQGVGFRPWLAAQAQALGVAGWVRNGSQGVQAELQGPRAVLDQLLARLAQQPPPLARIRAVHTQVLPALPGWAGFHIEASADADGPARTDLPPDTAPCAECLEEMFDPGQRRWRHPFINCTQCGPRFTVTARLPYDRAHTSLAGHALCPACEAEYRNPADRRHHAQPLACPQCGPQLQLWSPEGVVLAHRDAAVVEAVARLKAGQVLAVKGVGGYQLVADARQPAVLARLRQAKSRAGKPFALMVPNAASAAQWVRLGPAESALLQAPSRPILLLPCQPGVAAAHPGVAPGLADWGLMLPATPLHWVLCHEALGRPDGHAWRQAAQPLLWVVTSANPGGEPLVVDEAGALAELAGLCDALLVHDRAILGRLDDSVRRPMPGLGGRAAADEALHAPFVRRARGHVPEPVPLHRVPADAPSVLATGAWLKNTLCLTRGNEAFVSPHIGDLGSAGSRRAMVEALDRLRQFLGVQPQAVAHDLHPDFYSTQLALAEAAQAGVPALAVQHHHAHAAAVLAEHGELDRGGLALVLDGSGLGDDGSVWGGELLALQGPRVQRLGHLPTLALPGGDQAAQAPWRMGAAVLAALGQGGQIATRFARQPAAPMLAQWLARPGPGLARSSSAGRMFDAAAALLGVAELQQHEADAAMRLEALASLADPDGQASPWPDAWRLDPQGRLELTGLWQQLAASDPGAAWASRAERAAAFHASLAAALVAWVQAHAPAPGSAVALAGGCWLNRLLRAAVCRGLQAAGLRVLEAQAVPPGDGGLCLGQAALALQHLRHGGLDAGGTTRP